MPISKNVVLQQFIKKCEERNIKAYEYFDIHTSKNNTFITCGKRISFPVTYGSKSKYVLKYFIKQDIFVVMKNRKGRWDYSFTYKAENEAEAGKIKPCVKKIGFNGKDYEDEVFYIFYSEMIDEFLDKIQKNELF